MIEQDLAAYAHAEVHLVVLAKEVWIHPGAILGAPEKKVKAENCRSTCTTSHPVPSIGCSPCAPNYLRAPSGQICIILLSTNKQTNKKQ